MNLLLTAPLYDNRGSVRYFIGAQIDVSGLIDEGRGLDSFAQYLAENRPNRNRDSDHSDESFSQKHLRTLSEFGQMLSLDESSLFQKSHSRTSSVQDNASSYRGTANRPERMRQPRRVLGNDDEGEKKDEWALSSTGPSGKLPGVYQNVGLHFPHPCPPRRPPPSHFLPFFATAANLLTHESTDVVPPGPPVSLPPHHLRLSRTPHPRAPPIALPLAHRRSYPCPRGTLRRLRVRRRCHRKSDMAPQWTFIRRWGGLHKRGLKAG